MFQNKSSSTMSAIAAGTGVFFESYDFFLYVLMLQEIQKHFLQGFSASIAEILSLLIFGGAYFSRPLGGILLGHFSDVSGRKSAFIFSVMLMGIATFFIGLIPSASVIGFGAPILLLIFRLFQGLAFGGDIGVGMTYIYEHARKDQRCFFLAFPLVGALAGIACSVCMVDLVRLLTGEQYAVWGWRLVWVAALPIMLLSWQLRKRMLETTAFEELVTNQSILRRPIVDILKTPSILRQVASVIFGITPGPVAAFSITFMYTLIFIRVHGHVDHSIFFLSVILLCVCGSACFLFFGKVIPRAGERWVLSIGLGLFVVLLYPLLAWLHAAINPSTGLQTHLLPVALPLISLSVVSSVFYVCCYSLCCSRFQVQIRATAMGISINVSQILFSGFLPAIIEASNLRFGSPFAGLWFPFAECFLTLVFLCIDKGPPPEVSA